MVNSFNSPTQLAVQNFNLIIGSKLARTKRQTDHQHGTYLRFDIPHSSKTLVSRASLTITLARRRDVTLLTVGQALDDDLDTTITLHTVDTVDNTVEVDMTETVQEWAEDDQANKGVVVSGHDDLVVVDAEIRVERKHVVVEGEEEHLRRKKRSYFISSLFMRNEGPGQTDCTANAKYPRRCCR